MGNSWDHIVGTASYNDNFDRIKRFAASKGYVLNSDEERVEKVVGLMTLNKEKHGAYYCPCKQNHPLQPDDVLCPCPEIDTEIEVNGHCLCKLFYKKCCKLE